MQMLPNHPPSCPGRCRIAIVQTPQLVALEKLQPGDFIYFSSRSNSLMAGPGDSKVERLQAVSMISSGYIAADDQGELMQSQVVLEVIDIDVRRSKCRQFRSGNLFLQSGRARTCNYFDWIE